MTLCARYIVAVANEGEFTPEIEAACEDLEGMLDDVVRAFKKKNPDLTIKCDTE